MEEEKLLENISKSISNRLKIPIITTYICVLILYNWDIIYYLIFENIDAKIKIQYIKDEYGTVYYTRILTCLFLSASLIVIFTILNTFLNFCLKWFYRKDKEITSEIESFEKINVLSEQLSNSLDENENLNAQIENLKNINNNLASKTLNVNIADISKKDYEQTIKTLRSNKDSEKLIFSFKELIDMLRKNINILVNDIYELATYQSEMKHLISILASENLLKVKSNLVFEDEQIVDQKILELGRSFKDFLKIENS